MKPPPEVEIGEIAHATSTMSDMVDSESGCESESDLEPTLCKDMCGG